MLKIYQACGFNFDPCEGRIQMNISALANKSPPDDESTAFGKAQLAENFRRIKSLLEEAPELKPRYDFARKVVRAFRTPAFYEVETRCNLKCEGCYYFEGGKTQFIEGESDILHWRKFFESESQRGVSMAYFVGAEPALAQDRLSQAVGLFPRGNVGSNGTIRIDPDIPFRIGVSVWGGDDPLDKALRGASVFRKALKNYEGDPRAIMLFTVSRWTIDQIPTVARMCADHDVKLTFNLYSPTHNFLNRLATHSPNDAHFFRVSKDDHSPILRTEDLERARIAMNEAIDEWPGTVVYSKAYNDYICNPQPRYDISPETGIARDCKSRMVEPMRYFTTDLKGADVKCCTPDIDCSECRMYSGGWSSRFVPRTENIQSTEAFSAWLGMMETLDEIFLYPRIRRNG